MFLLNQQETPLHVVLKIKDELLDEIEGLINHPYIGPVEEYLFYLKMGHRRLVYGNFKVIYRIEGEDILVTDIFDTRQDPEKMKG